MWPRKVVPAAAIALVLAACSGCAPPVRGGEPNQTELYVLIDLSKTWFNQVTASRNARLLDIVAHGSSLVAQNAKQPYQVEWRPIGDASYMRDPICRVSYMQGIRRRQAASDRVSRPRDMGRYLSNVCVTQTLRRAPENETQISAAIASIAAEPKDAPTTRRYLMILSDFMEETKNPAPLPEGSLKGVSVMLVYRPKSEDQIAPAQTGLRVEQWRSLLQSKGAQVQVAPDTSMRAAQIVSFLQK